MPGTSGACATMSFEEAVTPSDMIQDTMPKAGKAWLWAKGLSAHGGVGKNHQGTQYPVRWRTKFPTRVKHRTYGARGAGEPALKAPLCREDCLGKCHADSGNPTVRDETGGLGKRGLWWKCEPTSQPKAWEW